MLKKTSIDVLITFGGLEGQPGVQLVLPAGTVVRDTGARIKSALGVQCAEIHWGQNYCGSKGNMFALIPETHLRDLSADAPSGRTINDWRPETLNLLDALKAAGCVLVSGDNGEEKFKFDGDLEKFVENLTACDESHLHVKTPTGGDKLCWLYLVYGNSPGELASDYSVDVTLDAVTLAHSERWEGRGQPKKLEA